MRRVVTAASFQFVAGLRAPPSLTPATLGAPSLSLLSALPASAVHDQLRHNSTTRGSSVLPSSGGGAPRTAFCQPPSRVAVYPPPFSPKDVRTAIIAHVPKDGSSVPIGKVLEQIAPRILRFLMEETGISVDAYMRQYFGGDLTLSPLGQLAYARGRAPNAPSATAARAPAAAVPPPPKPTFAAVKKDANTPFSQLNSRGAQQGFRSPSEVLEVLIDYVPTYAINVQTLVEALPVEVTGMFGTMTPLMFLKKYRFYFDVQQHHGVPEVKLRSEVAHPRRGIADVKYASGSGSADYLMNSKAAGPSAGIRKPPRNSEANLVMGLAPKCPSEYTPLGDFLAQVHEYVSTHPAFDARLGVTGLLEKYPEFFQILDGKVRVRPSTVAPGSIAELSTTDSPLPEVTVKLQAALPEAGKVMDTPGLFATLSLPEKQAIKQAFRSFPRYLRSHGKVFVVSPDNTMVKRFVPELERSADALASERLEHDSLSPSDPIHNIPAAMDADSSADWSVKELYDALPLMQAAELDDFKLILTSSVRDALPKDLAGELAKYPDYFSVWQYPDDETVTVVQRAKLTTPEPTDDELARAIVPMIPQGGLTTDQLLRRVPLPIQRYLYRTGAKKVIAERLKEYCILSGNRVMKTF